MSGKGKADSEYTVGRVFVGDEQTNNAANEVN